MTGIGRGIPGFLSPPNLCRRPTPLPLRPPPTIATGRSVGEREGRGVRFHRPTTASASSPKRCRRQWEGRGEGRGVPTLISPCSHRPTTKSAPPERRSRLPTTRSTLASSTPRWPEDEEGRGGRRRRGRLDPQPDLSPLGPPGAIAYQEGAIAGGGRGRRDGRRRGRGGVALGGQGREKKILFYLCGPHLRLGTTVKLVLNIILRCS